MQFHRRAALLSCCVVFLLSLLPPLRAASWGPPPSMDWDTFYALYEAAGAASDPADRVVTLTGRVRLSDGAYELGPTLSPVTVEAPGRTGFVVSGAGALTVDNPGLTVCAEENEMAAFTVSGGYLDLRTCAITGRNAPALLMLADGTHLSTGGGGRVTVDVTYDGASREGVKRAGIIVGGCAAPLRLHDLDLTVRGGDAAISTGSSLELYGCAVRAVSDPPVPAIFFENQNCTLTADGDTVIDPPPAETPPESGTVASVTADGTGSVWCLSGTEPAALLSLLPEAGTVWCVEDYRYEDGVPLVWALGALPDPLTAGEYALRGVPEEAALAALGVKNPEGAAGEYLLTVWDPAPPSAMRVESNPIPDGGAGRRATYKNLPPLAASGAEAVYIEYSADGAHWNRVRENTKWPYEEPVYSENLLESPYVDEETMEFTVDVPADGFYTRLVVVGGPFAGVSNTVDHGAAAPPEIEDGGSGGDHGGGGQGVHDRPGKEMPDPGPEPVPTPEAAPEPSPEPSPAPPADAEAASEAEPLPPSAAPGTGSAGRAAAAKPADAPALAVLSTPGPASTPAPAEPPPAQAVPTPGAPSPTPQTHVTPVSEPTVSVPGYAAAAGATAAALLAGAAWFHWRRKRK